MRRTTFLPDPTVVAAQTLPLFHSVLILGCLNRFSHKSCEQELTVRGPAKLADLIGVGADQSP